MARKDFIVPHVVVRDNGIETYYSVDFVHFLSATLRLKYLEEQELPIDDAVEMDD